MPTCKICNQNFPNHVKINGVLKNFQRRKYCLSCSPFNQHNTKKLHINKSSEDITKKICVQCKQEKNISEFYSKKDKDGKSRLSTSWCKQCNTKQILKRHQNFKKECVNYKGGKCELCGYNKYFGALEFHHKNPEEKEFSLSTTRSSAFDDKVKTELDKCLMLCCTCHREEHARINGLLD